MTWRGLWSIGLSCGLLLLAAASASADTTPQAPGVSGAVQPVSASAGSPSQPNNNASVSSGQAYGSTGNGAAEGNTCGVQAGAGGTGHVVQPTRVGTTGSSTPTGCTSTSGASGAAQGAAAGAGAGSNTNNLHTNANGAGANSAGASRSGLDALGLGGAWPWLFLALLLAAFFFILGVVVGPKRRKANAPATS